MSWTEITSNKRQSVVPQSRRRALLPAIILATSAIGTSPQLWPTNYDRRVGTGSKLTERWMLHAVCYRGHAEKLTIVHDFFLFTQNMQNGEWNEMISFKAHFLAQLSNAWLHWAKTVKESAPDWIQTLLIVSAKYAWLYTMVKSWEITATRIYVFHVFIIHTKP